MVGQSRLGRCDPWGDAAGGTYFQRAVGIVRRRGASGYAGATKKFQQIRWPVFVYFGASTEPGGLAGPQAGTWIDSDGPMDVTGLDGQHSRNKPGPHLLRAVWAGYLA